MRMKNLRLEVEKNELLVSNLNSLIGYCVDNNSVSLKFVSKHVRLKSVNTMIFHVVRLIRETRRSHMNAACADIAKVPQDDSSTTNSSDSNGIITSMDIFEVLPSVIRSVRFESKRITTTIIHYHRTYSKRMKVKWWTSLHSKEVYHSQLTMCH